jgi:putative FmdB family regulatory protein
MPVYEYKCNDCGKQFEFLMLRESDKDELKCSKCGGTDLERLLSVFGTGGGSSSDGASCTTPT